jgi:hypothetical protein
MSLLRDIQDATINSDIDISTVLRQCKVLAVRLGNDNFKKWVDQELNGYNKIDDLPNYRILTVQSKGYFSGYFGSALKNADIPLIRIPEKYRKIFNKAYCTQPISAYESLLKLSKGENFQEQWLPDFVALYGGKIYQNMNCMAAWKDIPHGSIVSLVDSVRNRVLNFVLEIESEAPDAGEAQINKPPLPQERVTQVFNTTIYGDVGNIAEGSTNVTQSSTLQVFKCDFESLRKQLLELDVPSTEIDELETAIKKDDKNEVIKNKSLGEGVTSWVGNLITKSAKGTIPILQSSSANIITKAILLYYGID